MTDPAIGSEAWWQEWCDEPKHPAKPTYPSPGHRYECPECRAVVARRLEDGEGWRRENQDFLRLLQRTDKARVAWREAWHLENRWTNPDSDVEWPQVSEAVAKARALDAECEEGSTETCPRLTVYAKKDGTWLEFKSNGKSALIRVETLADKHKNGVISSALNGWCRDRQAECEEGNDVLP